MELIYMIIGLALLVLAILGILMPVFVYRISNRAKEQMQWNKCLLEAQNKILQELYNIRIK